MAVAVVVYFDGYCNVCNRFIDFLIRRDRRHILKFAPLQGTTARARLPAGLVNEVSTMVMQEDGAISVESAAAIKAIASLGGVYSWTRIFLLVPRFLRDGAYRWVANHRYQLFGRRSTCRLPTAEERAQFLE
jgi:predicted DCC family thiol-disulfide oxidoreductase YuxK